jgi:hypothetical protein
MQDALQTSAIIEGNSVALGGKAFTGDPTAGNVVVKEQVRS